METVINSVEQSLLNCNVALQNTHLMTKRQIRYWQRLKAKNERKLNKSCK